MTALRHPEHVERPRRSGAGCICLARSTGRILLAFRSSNVEMSHTWSGFGGAMDAGESPDETARRELAEEAGYSGSYNLRPIYVYQSPAFTYWNFLAVVDEEFDPKLNWESDDARWFSLDEIPSVLHPGMKLCLDNPMTQGIIAEEMAKWSLDEAKAPVLPRPEGAIDPALLTHKEYLGVALRGVTKVWHPDDAYETDQKSLSGWTTVANYPEVIQRVRKNGMNFVVRMRSEKNRYVKWTEDKDILRDESGNAVYYTDEEATALGKSLTTYEFAIFDEQDKAVASFTDEWGCVLIQVASEFRGFGFGPYLAKIGRTVYPEKTSGGFTGSGRTNFLKVHKMFVSDALKNGRYREMLKQGKITVQRVKEIVTSVGIDHAPVAPDQFDLAVRPDDLLLFADGNGTFVIYDRKIKDLMNNPRVEHFAEQMIAGMIYVAADVKWGIMHTYGGEPKAIRQFLLRCAMRHCQENGCVLLIDLEDIDDVDPETMQVNHESIDSGYWRSEIKPKKTFDYKGLAAQEKTFRRSFDQYREFEYRLAEMAYAKFRPTRS